MIPPLDTSNPEPPDELIGAFLSGDAVLFAGAGLSARAGLPTWRPFVTGLLEWAGSTGVLSGDALRSTTSSLTEGHTNSVADVIVSNLVEGPARLHAYLREIFPPDTLPDASHRLLASLPFSAAVTTNFDQLLERSFMTPRPDVYVPADTTALQDALAKRRFFVLKLYGDLARQESLTVSPAQFQDSIAGNVLFANGMETLFFTRTLLFVGASFEGIDDFLQGVRLRRGNRSHFALVGVSDDGWRVRADLLERRYGIRVIPYQATPDHEHVDRLLSKLAAVIGPAPESATTTMPTTRLKRVVLQQIGPFSNLDLEFDPHWNILLGDNGVGKSSILRAVALAISGVDPGSAAARLIKSGGTHASIILETDRNTYHTEISMQTPERAEIRSIPSRPLEAERWLVMGFPPLRTVSWDRPRAPEPLARSVPSVEDVLPLVAGTIDPRLDRLKQLIVNLDYLSKDEQTKGGTDGGGRYERLLQQFFDVIGELAEGLTIERGAVNPSTYEVTVITDDGPLPIEAVSQGMTSLIGWVGILLQRLYEVYDDAADPTDRYALVLIDEIDAHLHPAWQRTLVQKLSAIFPNVQFIATTHSPLIIAGMPANQIIRFTRDENGQVVREEIDPQATMGRADQILRSDLFGLSVTMGTTTETKLARYQHLLGTTTRTTEEDVELQTLSSELQEQLRLNDQNQHLLQAQAIVLEQLSEQLKAESPDASDALMKSARQVRSDLDRSVAG